MDEQVANPLIVAVLFVLRCLGPVAIILGISYLLRRLGWISEPPAPPNGANGEAAALDAGPAAAKPAAVHPGRSEQRRPERRRSSPEGSRRAPAGRRGARR
jgi:hypothetical protein